MHILNKCPAATAEGPSHASEIIRDIEESGGSVVIALNGEARAVLQGIKEYVKRHDYPADVAFSRNVRRARASSRVVPQNSLFGWYDEQTRGRSGDPKSLH